MPSPKRARHGTQPNPPLQIVSGGQTGVDRGALRAAIAMGLDHGGWCPRHRLAEDGTVPSCFNLKEHSSSHYKDRTRQNVIDSDATLILYEGSLSGGTRLTYRYAIESGKPALAVPIDVPWDVAEVCRWLTENRPHTLNVAGPRESNSPGIEQRSMEAMLAILQASVD